MEPPVLRAPALLLLLTSLALPPAADPGFWSKLPDGEIAQRIVQEMSDEELVGQVLMLGYTGTSPSPEFLNWIQIRHIGGVKIFTRNVESLPSLAQSIRRMQSSADGSRWQIPLFVATDQEGGWVRQIKGETSVTPGNIALGASGLPRDALLTGYYIGLELKKLGINMNFAPTIDVYSNPQASVIGPRAFSSDPVTTSFLSLAYFKGMSHSGIVCTAKHYPGHGQADRDSHGWLPVVNICFDELWERDLLPYRVLIPEGLPAVMSGHLAYPRVLGDLTPASLSPYFIHEVLRERLGFDGLVVTDDLEMNGALFGGIDTARACELALRAGNDMVLISHSPQVQEQAWRHLLHTLKSDSAFKQGLQDSVRRILGLKLRAFKGGIPLLPEQPLNPSAVRSENAESFFRESALRSVTLLGKGSIPFKPRPGERILLIGQFEEFLAQGKGAYPQAETLLFPFSPFYSAEEQTRAQVHLRASRFDTLILCLANYNSLQILKDLKDLGKKIIVISALTPVYLAETPWLDSCLAVYGTGADSFKAGFAALSGQYVPEGKLSVHFLNLEGGAAR